MKKLDMKVQYKNLYSGKPGEITLIEVPAMNYLMIDGAGNPNDNPVFQECVSHLYGVSYTIKFKYSKADKAKDYVVGPLEGLWWGDHFNVFKDGQKDAWFWTLMITQPDFVTSDVFETALVDYIRKKKLSSVPAIRFEIFQEGTAVQAMHVGTYDEEAPLIARIHNYISDQRLSITGKHHEIYLSNPEKTVPGKMKTIIRQPCM